MSNLNQDEVLPWFCIEKCNDDEGFCNARIVGLSRKDADTWVNQPGTFRVMVPWRDLLQIVENGKKVMAEYNASHGH